MPGFEFHIKAPGVVAYAGPFSFIELRELSHAGLVTEDTLLADENFAYHELRAYPDLCDALRDPSVTEVMRRPVARISAREDVVRERDTNTAAPILDPTESDLIDFDAVRRGERGFAALDVLALNRVKEPPAKPIPQTPWYRRSRFIDLWRWLAFSSPLWCVVIACLPMLINALDKQSPLACAPGLVMGFSFLAIMLLWGWCFLIDYHYPGKNGPSIR